jgi:short-subunit dehydrogenase
VRWRIWTSPTISARNSPSDAEAESSSRGNGAENGVPCTANDGAAKAYVHSLGEALHYEFKPQGVYVTVLAAGFTNTAVLEKFGLDPKTMPMKPMRVEQCVSEALSALLKNRSRIVPGRLNRILNALVPASLARKMEADFAW